MQFQKLGGPPLKFFTPAKFLVDFTQLPTLIANISGTFETRYQKSERHVISSDSSCVRRTRSGDFWSTIHKVVHVSLCPPKSTFFGRLYFSH